MARFKLGKLPAQYDHRDLLMAKYLDISKLPPIPDQFGHETLISDWGMLGNNNWGDCVWAGAGHETMLWTKESAVTDASFTDANVLSDYSAVTGFTQSDPNTDQGTDMHDAMKYRRQTGIVDSSGKRHKIGAYIWLEPGNVQHLLAAVYLFGAVGVGFEFPGSAMDQFNSGLPWAVVGGSQIQGGHYVPVVANRKNLVAVTWGQLQQMTTGFYQKFNDESVAMISADFLTSGKTPEGFDVKSLVADADLLRK